MSQILEAEGNLLDFPPYHKSDPDKYIGMNAIAHSCNTQNIMGAGIARQIKNRYPQAYFADTQAYKDCPNLLGKFSKAEVKCDFLPDGKGYIYNMYTQSTIGSGREVDYEKFWTALKAVETDLFEMNINKHEYDSSSPPVLGLPYGISCGLAGGSWSIIKSIIEDIFVDSPIQCYIVKFDLI